MEKYFRRVLFLTIFEFPRAILFSTSCVMDLATFSSVLISSTLLTVSDCAQFHPLSNKLGASQRCWSFLLCQPISVYQFKDYSIRNHEFLPVEQMNLRVREVEKVSETRPVVEQDFKLGGYLYPELPHSHTGCSLHKAPTHPRGQVEAETQTLFCSLSHMLTGLTGYRGSFLKFRRQILYHLTHLWNLRNK